ncbi:hypothetical protein MGN70_008488 [Eutypa lata]|nr:hypothetical protein MGN70_008488 [Eutypa lata]
MQVTSLLVALTFATLGSTSPAEVEPNKVVDVQPQQTCDISVCKRDCEAAGGVLEGATCWGEAPVCDCRLP